MKYIKQILIVVIVIMVSSVVVKAGDGFLGGKSDDGNGCEEGMVRVENSSGGFCIDIYEVSAGEDCPYPNPENQMNSRTNIDSPKCELVSGGGQMPWRFISQNQAQMACSKMGKRLPTNKEWEMAALGTPDHLDKNLSTDCHIEKNWQKQPGMTGSGENCKSSAGIYDMIGNVWEWTGETAIDGKIDGRDLPGQGFIASVDGEGFPAQTSVNGDENYYNDYFWIKTKGVRGIARGGYWNNKEKAGVYSVYAVPEPSFAGPGVGFRCVK